MFHKNIILFVSATFALAEALPQDAAATSVDYGAAATSIYGGSYPSFTADTGSLNSELSLLSGMPTLPASVESVLQTAIPTTAQSDVGCAFETTTPGWFKSLPADVKSALTSYETAYASWYSQHSAQLGALTESIPAGCTAAAAQATAAGNGGTATTSGGSSGATKTGSGSASTGGAARSTGAVAVSFMGAVGVLGLLVAL